MLRNIYAHTEPRPAPAYLSVNVDELGAYTIAVRSRGEEQASVIEILPEQLRDLAVRLLAELPPA